MLPVRGAWYGAAVPDSLPPALAHELLEAVGEEGLITERSRLLVYESDALTAYRVPPRAVVLPTDTAQAAAVVGALARRKIPFVPRGAGTGLSGGALATHDAVPIGTARMNRILVLDAPGRRARVQAGVVNAALSAAARPHGLHFPPDPSSETACIGGRRAS